MGLLRWRRTIRNGTFRSESLGISYFGVQIRDSGHVQVAIYTVLDEESESEVEKCNILPPGGTKIGKTNVKLKIC